MKRPTPKIKVFIDTSVLIAGLASVTGAAATVLDLCESEIIQMVISRQVLIEADRNFSAKLPRLVDRFRQFMNNIAPLMVEDPSVSAVEKAAKIIDRKDAPILAAALESEVDFLISLDRKHFLTQRMRGKVPIKVLSPSEFLRMFERLCYKD